MTFERQIYITIRTAKFYSGDLMTEIGTRQTYGEDVTKLKKKFVVLGEWIRILQFYLDNNFDGNGNITPIETCLTQVQIESLISKVKLAIGNKRYTIDQWILAYGIFDVSGIWDNSGQWNNYPPLN